MKYRTTILQFDSDRSLAGISRRTLLGLSLPAILLTCDRASYADTYTIFGVHAPQLEALHRDWQTRAKDYEQELAASKHPNTIRFRRRLTSIPRGLLSVESVRAVNQAVNAAAPYIPDYESSRGRHQWATPIEFLERGGDCEDFALTKAATLNHLGWPLDKMYLAIGVLELPQAKPQGHAMLVVVLGESLDSHFAMSNTSDELVSLQRFRGFRPVYAVDSSGVMMFVSSK